MLLLTQKQVQAFDEMMRQSFEDRMVAHLRKHFPKQTAKLSEQQLRHRIQQETTTAQSYGITSECEVAAYISIVFSVSPDKPATQLEWVRSTLESAEPPGVKVHRLLQFAELHALAQREVLSV